MSQAEGRWPAPGEIALADDGSLLLGARRIPLPSSVSHQARAWLAMPRLSLPARPPLEDTDAWRRRVAQVNADSEPRVAMMMAQVSDRARVDTRTVDGVLVHVGTPVAPRPERREWLRITVHGGALLYLGGAFARAEAALLALQSGCEAWSVDYRVPPDHPYPAAVDDVIAVYRAALATRAPQRIAISGGSAGGNIAAAAVLKARDLGLPLPAALGLFTPECDLTESGDSFATNRDVDNVLPMPLPEENAIYAGGADLRDPCVSPLFGDFAPGFPPTQIQTGTRDLFLSNSVRMHRALRAAGVPADLHVWEAMPHGGFGPDAPESADARREFDEFLSRHLG